MRLGVPHPTLSNPLRWFAIAALFLVFGCDDSPDLRIGWVTTEPNPAIGQAMIDAVDQDGIEVTIFDNKDALRDALADRSIDLALMENPEKNDPELRALMPVFESVLHVLVKKEGDSCVATPLEEQLLGAKIYAGPKGSAGHRVLEILAAGGVVPSMEELQLLDTPFGDPAEVYFIFGGILSEDAVSRLDGFCLRSLDDPAALGAGSTVEGLALRHRQLEPFLIPRGLYSSLTSEPALTVSIKSILATHAQLDDDAAYEIVETTSEIGPTIRQLYPLANFDFSRDIANTTISLQFHPASLRYLERDAPGFIERYAEVLAFSVTLLVALVSAGVALIGQRRRNRKDRLDDYFVRVMDIRTRWESGTTNRDSALAEAQALQATVIQLLVDERIDADQALVSFLLVSNNLMSDVSAVPA